MDAHSWNGSIAYSVLNNLEYSGECRCPFTNGFTINKVASKVQWRRPIHEWIRNLQCHLKRHSVLTNTDTHSWTGSSYFKCNILVYNVLKVVGHSFVCRCSNRSERQTERHFVFKKETRQSVCACWQAKLFTPVKEVWWCDVPFLRSRRGQRDRSTSINYMLAEINSQMGP